MEPVERSAGREPAFNLPPALMGLIGVLLLSHALVIFLPIEQRLWAIEQFAFIPARLTFAGGGPQEWWMWLTYAFLHGDWFHVGMNVLWLAIFGSPVLVRIGVSRFAALSVTAAIASVAMHAVAHWGDAAPVIGYSGVVSAMTGAAARFAFGNSRLGRRSVAYMPRLSIVGTLTNRSSLGFIAVWMVANLLAGSGMLTPDGPQIAWEAHVGGFLAGLLLFDLFDRQPPEPAPVNESDEPFGSTER